MPLPSTVHEISENHSGVGSNVVGRGMLSFEPSDFANLVRPWEPIGSPSLGALNFELPEAGIKESLQLETKGYFFYRKLDFCGHWVLAANPVTGQAHFWFRHWTVSSSLPLFSNTDYVRTFRFSQSFFAKAFLQTVQDGKLVKEVEWGSLPSISSIGRLDVEFIDDPNALVPIPGINSEVRREYAVIIRAYKHSDSKTFLQETRDIIPTISNGSGSAEGGPVNRDLENHSLTPDELSGKDVLLYKNDFVSQDKKQKLTIQLALRFTKTAPPMGK